MTTLCEVALVGKIRRSQIFEERFNVEQGKSSLDGPTS